MKTVTAHNQQYRLPNDASEYQERLFVHLIDWKWNHLTREPGYIDGEPCDILLPESFAREHQPIYRPVLDSFLDHNKKAAFQISQFVGHMANPRAACVNLFLPLLREPDAAPPVLRVVKRDLNRIATDCFDQGYRIEFWDSPDDTLNDHWGGEGTSADVAIAYYDRNEDLNLWLVTCALGEDDLPPCPGYRSQAGSNGHACSPVAEILKNESLCACHGEYKYRYWDVTSKNHQVFSEEHLLRYEECPFKGGMNKLWRNQLLALEIQDSTSHRWPFRRVYSSVVYHPGNRAVVDTIGKFTEMIDHDERFSAFAAGDIINAASGFGDPAIREWAAWYRDFYSC